MNSTKQKISVATIADLDEILNLFHQALQFQGKGTYQVWDNIDAASVEKDILAGRQYKIEERGHLSCIFSVQYADPLIWRERDHSDAIYLHRIVIDNNFKGQRYFQHVVDWSIGRAQERNVSYLRMDTWASNANLIAYYQTFGFNIVGYVTTGDSLELPPQNRNLSVVLLEKAVIG